MEVEIKLVENALLDVGGFITRFDKPIGELATSPEVLELHQIDAETEFHRDDSVKKQIRDMLRSHGFKPTGRSKPASEYLVKAFQQKRLASINVPVDICNAVSLHTGIPISVVDLDLLAPDLKVDFPDAGTRYVFNQSGQEMDIGNLLCLFDQLGPCANAVKDSQRTKTNAGTTSTLTLIWGARSLVGRTERAEQWYRSLLESYGQTSDVQFV